MCSARRPHWRAPGSPLGLRHPERLSLQVLSALCDILGCTPADLITTNAQSAGIRKAAAQHVFTLGGSSAGQRFSMWSRISAA